MALGLSLAGLMTWNSLPKHLRDPVYTVSGYGQFLKTFFSFQSTNVSSALGAFLASMHCTNSGFT